MSSGFVSAGTVDDAAKRDEEWRKAREELDDDQRKEQDNPNDGRSLYEVLQANKGGYARPLRPPSRVANMLDLGG